MRKSKYIFAIMAVVYLAAAMAGMSGGLVITENILLGLSVSALFSAVSDIFGNILQKQMQGNEFSYIIRITSEFLADKIANEMYSQMINVRNVKFNVEAMSKDYKKAVHPNEYYKRRSITVINMISQTCFIIAIAAMVLGPFLPVVPQQSVSILLTLFAFAAMCFNLYMGEIIADIAEKRNNFMLNTQLIIQMGYPDFNQALTYPLNYHEDYVANSTQKKEGQEKEESIQ